MTPETMDDLKQRLEVAHKNLQDATQTLQIAQQAHQKATNEYNVWNAAVSILMREEQEKVAAKNQNQLSIDLPAGEIREVRTALSSAQAQPDSEAPNKTEIVRELLRQHPTGMTPTEIWRAVSKQFRYRAYLYSVLKRLRDRNEVVFRRKKYVFQPQQQEAPQSIVLQ